VSDAMPTKDFLFELGTEELPPKALKQFITSLAVSVFSQLEEAGIPFDKDRSELFASPRRLALRVVALAEKSPVSEVEVWGPPVKVAFDDDGKPTKAAEAFAKKNKLDASQLKDQIKNDGKADKLFCTTQSGGEDVGALLPNIIEKALKQLPIPKRMRWGARKAEFVRPVHWTVMLFGEQVIDCEILEHKASNITRGHRFHADGELTIKAPADYQQLLKDHYVIACFAERRNLIRKQLAEVSENLKATAVIDDDLLDEVTALVEWPVALAGNFDKQFLDVPAEALISSMSEHQKYFHVVDDKSELLPHFITIANLESKDPAQVIDGNERVIRPRLTDAAFFFETDKKQSLESRREKLKNVVFQEKLGSIYDKAERIASLAGHIAEQINADKAVAERAGALCKADLVSDMVLEFDKMQGIAGRYYALNDGEPEAVAEAIKEHYQPKFAGDDIPDSLEGCCVALADRLDTLTGIFGIGQKPTGSKDPFALRRATIGSLSIILGKQFDLDLISLLRFAQQQHSIKTDENLAQEVFDYMIERFRAMYQDQHVPLTFFNAVHAKGLSNPYDIDMRVAAVNAFSLLPEAEGLAAANKRVSNILAKLDSPLSTTDIDLVLLQEDEEKNLAQLVSHMNTVLEPHLSSRNYTEALCALAELQDPVDLFFDKVMVNVDDAAVRNNRLALLSRLRELFLNIADISYLVPEKK